MSSTRSHARRANQRSVSSTPTRSCCAKMPAHDRRDHAARSRRRSRGSAAAPAVVAGEEIACALSDDRRSGCRSHSLVRRHRRPAERRLERIARSRAPRHDRDGTAVRARLSRRVRRAAGRIWRGRGAARPGVPGAAPSRQDAPPADDAGLRRVSGSQSLSVRPREWVTASAVAKARAWKRSTN